MMSVFYDVICLESVGGGSNAPIESHFLTVFLKFEPQNVVGDHVNPNKALPYVTTHVLSHCASKSTLELLQ